MSIFIDGASMKTCVTSVAAGLNSSAMSGMESVKVGSGCGALGAGTAGPGGLAAAAFGGGVFGAGAGCGASMKTSWKVTSCLSSCGSAYSAAVSSVFEDSPSCGGSSPIDGALRMIDVVAVLDC